MPWLPYFSSSQPTTEMPCLSQPEGLGGRYLGSWRKPVKGHKRFGIILLSFFIVISLFADEPEEEFYFRGRFYLDWLGASYQNTDFYHQLSSRVKVELFNKRGRGWNLLIDTRNRTRLSEKTSNHLILYDARIHYERASSPWFFSLGQMNLYDTSGIGQLLGGLVGFKPKPGLLLGGYAGLESSIYISRTDGDYRKFGVFARYLGNRGKRFSISYNLVRYAGETERQYVYLSSLFPAYKNLVFYGNLEYELASHVQTGDRLSRIFLNVRYDPVNLIDVTAHYSSGRGLDYHGFVIEASKNPTLNDRTLEHFYYTRQYGIRLSLKPIHGIRLFVARRESEQKDDNIRNHTWRFGLSALNIAKTGFTVYGNYAVNRGEISESDSYYVSLAKDFGRISWSVSFSNTFNGLRYIPSFDAPQVIHMVDYKTIASDLFIPISQAFALSLQYEYFIQKESNQHLFFIRVLLRK
jgi:hypothetical protein